MLGPVELVAAGRPVQIRAAKQRDLVALLLLDRDRPASGEWLIDQLWSGESPSAARATLQSYVYRLRKLLESLAAPIHLHTRSGGYVLELPPGSLDLDRFEQAMAEGQQAWEAGRAEEAASGLRSGLALWRGEAFEGVDLPLVRDAASRLDKRRQAAVELWLTAELATGRHAEVLGELENLTTRYPLRESLWRLRMLALVRSERKVDALAAYRTLYQLLDDELGIQPSAPVRDLHQQILTDDATLDEQQPRAPAAPARAMAPRMLPVAIDGFTGRKEQLSVLDDLLPAESATGRPRPDAVVISAISGTAGIGKTMLAVHWAHRVAGQFPDGQLYVDLRGFHPSGQPVPATQAVRGFLDALGVPAERIPASVDAQLGLYRSLLADRQVLVLLDNAHDSEQVRLLLPGAPGCLVLVTSRNQLTGLVTVAAAKPLLLDLLSVDESRELLARRLGQDRVDAEPQAVRTLIAACARLPLALAVVAARAATHPDFPLDALATELAGTDGGLDAFADTDASGDVRAVFSWSYGQLQPEAARLFRLLGLHPGPDISAPAAASLAALPPAQARRSLSELCRAHLITEHQPGRYRFHDLLRAYSAELVHAHDSETDRDQATRRMLDHYLHTAFTASPSLYPPFGRRDDSAPHPGVQPESPADFGQATAWFSAECPVLLAVLGHASNAGFDRQVWQLASALNTFFTRQGHRDDWVAIQQAGLEAASRLADPAAQARAHRGLANAYRHLDQPDEAHSHLLQAAALYRAVEDQAGMAHTSLELGRILAGWNRHTEALAKAQEARELYQRVGEQAGQARAFNSIGWYHAQLGDHGQALHHCERALELFRGIRDLRGEADAWDSLGYANHHLGLHEEAIACYWRALALFEETGSRSSLAEVLLHLGDTEHAVGDVRAAADHWRQALDILDALGHPGADGLRRKLADATPE